MNDLPESPRVARNRRDRHGRAAKAQHVANLGTHLAETVDELNEVLDHYGGASEELAEVVAEAESIMDMVRMTLDEIGVSFTWRPAQERAVPQCAGWLRSYRAWKTWRAAVVATGLKPHEVLCAGLTLVGYLVDDSNGLPKVEGNEEIWIDDIPGFFREHAYLIDRPPPPGDIPESDGGRGRRYNPDGYAGQRLRDYIEGYDAGADHADGMEWDAKMQGYLDGFLAVADDPESPCHEFSQPEGEPS